MHWRWSFSITELSTALHWEAGHIRDIKGPQNMIMNFLEEEKLSDLPKTHNKHHQPELHVESQLFKKN